MCAVAQDSASIRVRYSVQQDAVLLRWGADTPYAWKKPTGPVSGSRDIR